MHGIRNVFPEAWRAFATFLPEAERGDLLASYYRRLTDPDPAVHLPAAHAWDRYEGACSTLLPQADAALRFDGDAAALAIARIEAHYFVHQGFLREGELLAGVPRIRHLPCTHRAGALRHRVPADHRRRAGAARGRRPSTSSCPDAGHSVREPGITRELVAAVRRMQKRLPARPTGG